MWKLLPTKNGQPAISRLRLMQEMTEAENAWMAEVESVFGTRDAGLVGFQARGTGEPGSQLNVLYTAYVASRDAYTAS